MTNPSTTRTEARAQGGQWWRTVVALVTVMLMTVFVPARASAEEVAPPPVAIEQTTEQRIGGFDRYGVAANLSRWLPGVDARKVVIASGEVFADALSVGPAAAQGRSRLLLVTKDTIPVQTAAELQRTPPESILVVGGPGTISEAVLARLGAVAPVTRVGGADRYAVASSLAAGTASDHVVIASGEVFSDALSAGPLAAKLGAPLLLTRGTALPSATAQSLSEIRPRTVTVLGGPGTVSDEVLREIASISGAAVSRIGGRDRYEVAANVAHEFFTASDTVLLASGTLFADGLSGTPLAHAWGAPILLSTGTCIPSVTHTQLSLVSPGHRVYLGGPSSVTSSPFPCGTSQIREGVNPTPVPVEDPVAVGTSDEEAVYFVPHQDDELISMVGGIDRDVREGRRVHVFLLNAGYWTAVKRSLCELEGRCLTDEQITASRNAEVLSSLEALGVPAGNVHFFAMQEELVGADVLVRDLVTRVVAASGPSVRYRTMSWLDTHPSHFSVAYALRDACRDSLVMDCEFFQSPLYQQRAEALQYRPVVTPPAIVRWAPLPQVVAAASAYRVDRPELGRHAIGWRSVSNQISWIESHPNSWAHGAEWTSPTDEALADEWIRTYQGGSGTSSANRSQLPFEEVG